MSINTILDQLSEHLQCEQLELDNNGLCRLVFDDKFVVDMEYIDTQEKIRFYSVIKSQADELEKSDYVAILSANLTEMNSAICYFAFDEEMNEIVLMATVDLENLHITDFIDKLAEFVNLFEKWTEQLDSGLKFNNGTEHNIPSVIELDQSDGLRL